MQTKNPEYLFYEDIGIYLSTDIDTAQSIGHDRGSKALEPPLDLNSVVKTQGVITVYDEFLILNRLGQIKWPTHKEKLLLHEPARAEFLAAYLVSLDKFRLNHRVPLPEFLAQQISVAQLLGSASRVASFTQGLRMVSHVSEAPPMMNMTETLEESGFGGVARLVSQRTLGWLAYKFGLNIGVIRNLEAIPPYLGDSFKGKSG